MQAVVPKLTSKVEEEITPKDFLGFKNSVLEAIKFYAPFKTK